MIMIDILGQGCYFCFIIGVDIWTLGSGCSTIPWAFLLWCLEHIMGSSWFV